MLGAQVYDLEFVPEPACLPNLGTDAGEINYRVYATHDLNHSLCGVSLDGFGEIGVISISVGQFNHPGLGFLDLISLLLSWFKSEMPEQMLSSHEDRLRTASHTFRMISHGLDIAAAAKPLFPVIWEERLADNIDDLRAELGIIPVTEGPISWYSNPAIAAALAE